MKIKLCIPCLFLSLIILLSGCTKTKTNILYDRKYLKEIKSLRNEVSKYMMINNIPGATVSVAKNGKIIYSEGFGFASHDLEVKATRNTKFRIGNVSECFTAVIYELLVKEGKLNPDSSLQHYLPEFKNHQYPLPIKHLAYHTSGIRYPKAEEENWRALNVSLTEGIDQIKNDTLIYPPGMMQNQNMFNYNLLGALMEKSTGKTFNTLLKEYITDTLKLSNTLIDNPYAVIKGRGDFYELNIMGQMFNATTYDLRYKASSEGILSNAEDLVKFGNAIYDTKILSENQKSDLLEPILLADNKPSVISKGWIKSIDKEGRIFYGRAGGVVGGGASLIIYPEEKLVVAVTVNVTDKQGQIPVILFANQFLNPVKKEENDTNP